MNVHDRRGRPRQHRSALRRGAASRLLLGTAHYPSPQVMREAVKASRAPASSRSRCAARWREPTTAGSASSTCQGLGVRVLPNTAGCRTPKEAITTAQMARELFGTDWVKLEVIGNDDTLQPDLFGLVEAAATPDQGRLQGVSLHHRGPGRSRAPAGCGLRGPDAVGRADRHRPRPRQPLCAAHPARILSRQCRSSSMRASARHRTRQRPWRWASTPCC